MYSTIRRAWLVVYPELLAVSLVLFASVPLSRAQEKLDEVKRQKKIDAKNEEMARMLREISDLKRQGKFRELEEYEKKWREKFGTSPESVGLANRARLTKLLDDLRQFRDEQSPEYKRALHLLTLG